MTRKRPCRKDTSRIGIGLGMLIGALTSLQQKRRQDQDNGGREV
jgi:hypothetical protein